MILPLLVAAPLLAPAAAGPVAPVPPVVETKRVSERVELETEDGVSLVADYYTPRKKGTRAPAALLVHDADGDRTSLTKVAERLHKQGFAVLAIDLRGHGESTTPDRAWAKLDERRQEKLWALSTRDLAAASSWLRDRKEVHSTNLNLVGVRAGCTLVVKHAIRDESVRSLVLLEPPRDQFGHDLQGDIVEVEGIPTLAVARRAEKAATAALVDDVNEASVSPWVELDLRSAKTKDLLEDRKLPAEVSRWMRDKAMPKRTAGRGR
jgi:pimeloyl-ACP methyl ester carboxylesterase